MSEKADLLKQLSIDKNDRIEASRSGAPRGSNNSKWFGLMVLMLVIGGAAGWWYGQQQKIDRPEVKVATAKKVILGQPNNSTSSEKVLNATGYVTARRSATVSSKATGRIQEVFIEEGQFVEEGQVLAQLDASNVEKELALATSNWRSSQNRIQETQARLKEAKHSLNRKKALKQRQLISQAELDSAQAAYDSLKAQLNTRRSESETAKNQVKLIEQTIDDLIIRAPFSGVVIGKNAQPGEMISPISAGGGFTRTGICSIVDMTSLEIEVDVNEAYINRVTTDQKVEALLDAYPDWKISAYVIAIIPAADRQKATVKVRIGFKELDPRILPDMGIKVAFFGAEANTQKTDEISDSNVMKEGIRVEISAVQQDGDQAILFIEQERKAFQRSVKVQKRPGEATWVVLEGLNPGERYIINPPSTLYDGQEIQVVR